MCSVSMNKTKNPKESKRIMTDKVGGVEVETIIFFLHHCMILERLDDIQTEKYFHERLKLTWLTIRYYPTGSKEMVKVQYNPKGGEIIEYCLYTIRSLPRLYKEAKPVFAKTRRGVLHE